MTYSKSKNRSLIDEFQSVFEASAQPEFDITSVPIDRLLVVYDRSNRNERAAATADAIAERYNSTVTEALVPHATAPAGRSPKPIEGDISSAIKTLISETEADLVILPCPFYVAEEQPESHSMGGIVDELIGELATPFLLVRTTSTRPPFDKMMLYVPGTIGVEQGFSLAFELVAENGALELYHVVDENIVQTAAEALEVVTEVQTDVGRSALIAGLQQQVHLLLNQAAKSARDLPFELTTLIELGHPVEKAIERAGSEQYGTVVLRIRPGEREEHDHLSEQMARDLDDVHVLVV